MSIPRPLNAVSNYRKIVVMQEVVIAIGNSTDMPNVDTETYNGLRSDPLKFGVCVQPFVSESEDGTVKMRHAVITAVGANGYPHYVRPKNAILQPDILEIMQRYSSFRVAGLRVELEPWDFGIADATTSTVDSSHGPAFPQWDISCAFDMYDTQGADATVTSGAHPPTLYGMKRMPYFKRIRWTRGGWYGSGSLERFASQAPKKYVLFSRTFKAGAGGATTVAAPHAALTNTAVLPGDWDHTPIFDTNYDSAYERSQVSTARSGKLWIDFRIGADLGQAVTYARDTTHDVALMKVRTFHTIVLKNDVDGGGAPLPQP